MNPTTYPSASSPQKPIVVEKEEEKIEVNVLDKPKFVELSKKHKCVLSIKGEKMIKLEDEEFVVASA